MPAAVPKPRRLVRSAKDYVNLGHNKVENHLKTQQSELKEELKPTDTVTYRIGQFLWTNFFGFVYHYVKSRFGRRHPYSAYPKQDDSGVYRIPPVASFALLSDWASDTEESDKVGRLAARYEPDYSIHLGDVYFVGTQKEVAANFLIPEASWPWGRCGSLALSGNHEMYSNGRAFFETLLPKMWIEQSGIRVVQKAGFFCLENDYWRVIGLDTGYTSVRNPVMEILRPPDCRLKDAQLHWLRDQVGLGNPEDRRGLLFLSHHPPFSVFREAFPEPARQLVSLLGAAKRPAAWIWGHEHRLIVYSGQPLTGEWPVHGRCIGHGGMPVELDEPADISPIVFRDDRIRTRLKRKNLGYNGFAYLRLDGPEALIQYVDLDNTLVYQEVLRIEEGAVVVEG